MSRTQLYGVDNTELSPTLREQLIKLGKSWGWLLAAGICFIALGVIAYLWPVASTVSLTIALGALFVVGGVIRIIQAIQLRREIGTGWRVFDAVLSLAAGVLLLRYPGGGMIAVSIAMIFYFFMSAVTKAAFAFATRPLPGSGWAFVSAIASAVLGVLMISTFPISALWLPGLLLGVDFVFYGATLVSYSFGLRKLYREFGSGVAGRERRAA